MRSGTEVAAAAVVEAAVVAAAVVAAVAAAAVAADVAVVVISYHLSGRSGRLSFSTTKKREQFNFYYVTTSLAKQEYF